MVQNIQYLNGLPSHVNLPFEYQIPILFGIQISPVFRCSVFGRLLYRYKDVGKEKKALL